MIKVYKRNPVENTVGWSVNRPWNVKGDPVDSRETCWPSWDEAMEWATMEPEKRKELIRQDDIMDGGW